MRYSYYGSMEFKSKGKELVQHLLKDTHKMLAELQAEKDLKEHRKALKKGITHENLFVTTRNGRRNRMPRKYRFVKRYSSRDGNGRFCRESEE